MPSTTLDDEQLVALRRNLLLKRCLRWTGGNLPEAEDLLGDAWLRVLEGAEQQPGSRVLNPRSFLLTVINNLGRDRLRRARRWQRGDDVDCETLEALTSSAEHLVFLRELLAATAKGLGRAGERQRAALLLRSSGVEYSRIAVFLSTSEPNARKLVETARGLLRETASHGAAAQI